MECRINIVNRKTKMRQQATWVISAVKTFPPNINLSCINNDMVSSCCKSDVDKMETATLYKWIYYIPDKVLKNVSTAWYETSDQCTEDALHNIQRCHPNMQDILHLYIY